MLKNKPNERWIYKCLVDLPPLRKEEMFSTEEKELNPQHFKKVAFYRYAFIGDMQERLNEAMGKDLIKYYAQTVSCSPRGTYTRIKTVYLPALSIKEKIKNWIFKTFNITNKKKEQEDLEYFASLFGEKQNHYYP